MANKDLTYLKVYGNDDPSGSVYTVGGGTGGGNLILTTATETVEGEEIIYLIHTTDGSIATWQEIYDALASGVSVLHVESVVEEGKHGTMHMVRQARIVYAENDTLDYIVGEAVITKSGTLLYNSYVAFSATGPLVFQDNTTG